MSTPQKSIGVIGAGTMGAGIAQSAAHAGGQFYCTTSTKCSLIKQKKVLQSDLQGL